MGGDFLDLRTALVLVVVLEVCIRPVGRLIELVVDVGPRVAAVITPGSFEALGLEPGRRVGLTLKATAVHAVSVPVERQS